MHPSATDQATSPREAADGPGVREWANRFGVLSDPSRLMLLLCIHRAGQICVSDLAAATGLKSSTVSQSLRLLRAEGIVETHRDGRVIRYELVDDTVRALVGQVAPDAGAEDVRRLV